MAERKPNDQFREARQRTGSRANPEECLSRQELAELANAWIWEHRHKKFELNANYVGKLEQGVIRWPGAPCREAFREILNVPKDSELGFVNARARRAAVKLEDVKRRNLFETATALGVSGLVLGDPVAALLLEDSEPPPVPRRVGASDIEQIRSATPVFESWSRTYGSGLIKETVMGHLRWSARLLKEALCPDRLRPELHSAVGDLADVAGYMAHDVDAQEEARRVYRFGLYCAEQAKDWNLRSEILSSMAGQASRTGQPDDGLTLAELALVRADRLTATGRAMLHADRAFALATMHQVQETLTAIGTADDHFAHSAPDNDPPFMIYYNTATHAVNTGRTLVKLAILGRDPGEASNRLTTAIAGYSASHARPRAIAQTHLASLTMATGDPLEAASIGHQALDIADAIRSHRATEELRKLSRYAAPHQQLEEVAHLRQRIATLVCTDNP